MELPWWTMREAAGPHRRLGDRQPSLGCRSDPLTLEDNLMPSLKPQNCLGAGTQRNPGDGTQRSSRSEGEGGEFQGGIDQIAGKGSRHTGSCGADTGQADVRNLDRKAAQMGGR